MSLIVDANCAAAAFGSPICADFVPIVEALRAGKARLVVGGKLKREYQLVGAAWRYWLQLDRAGRAFVMSDADVDAEEQRVRDEMALESDDPHIVALALVSGARLLCSRDQALHRDFKNPAIISSPRGSVYQDATHKGLIRKCCKVK